MSWYVVRIGNNMTDYRRDYLLEANSCTSEMVMEVGIPMDEFERVKRIIEANIDDVIWTEGSGNWYACKAHYYTADELGGRVDVRYVIQAKDLKHAVRIMEKECEKHFGVCFLDSVELYEFEAVLSADDLRCKEKTRAKLKQI